MCALVKVYILIKYRSNRLLVGGFIVTDFEKNSQILPVAGFV